MTTESGAEKHGEARSGEAEEPDGRRPKLVRTALLLLPLQVVFRAGEGLLPLLLAVWFGRSDATDVYYFAFALFACAGSLIFSAYQDSALIPVLAELRRKDPDAEPRVLGSLLAHTLVYGGALSLTIGALALGWFRVRYGSTTSFELAAMMVPLFCMSMVAMATKTFFFAVLASGHRYFAQPLASAGGILFNLAIVYLLRTRLGVAAIPLGSVIGETFAAATLGFIATRRAGIRVSLTLSRPPAVRQFAKLVTGEIAGGAVTRINPMVDQFMASLTRVVGGGTLLRYSNDISSVSTSLLASILLSPLLAHLSEDAAERKYVQFRRTIMRATLVSIAALTAVCLVLYAIRRPLLKLVFLHGEMDAAGVDGMAAILPYHLVGIPAFGVLLVLARGHIALQNARIFLPLGILNAVINAAMNVPLLRALGLGGLALSTSIVQIVVAVAFYILLERRLREMSA